MSAETPDRPGLSGRLVPVATLIVMALALGGTVVGLALHAGSPSSVSNGGFDASIHNGVTEAFTLSGTNPQVSSSGSYLFTQDDPGADSTTTTLYSLPKDLTSAQPSQVWSGTCSREGFWGDKLLCDSTLVSTDGSTTSFPEGEGRDILASSSTVVVLGKTTDQSENLSTVEIEGVGTDGSVVWTAQDPYLGGAFIAQAGRRSWGSSEYLTGITRANATHHPAQSQLIEVSTGTVRQTADSNETLLTALSDGYAAFPAASSGTVTIHHWDGTVVYEGTYNQSTDRPDGDDSGNFTDPPMSTADYQLVDQASEGMTKPVVLHDGEATLYEGVATSTTMACDSLTTEGASIDTSSMSDGASCDLNLLPVGPRSILVASAANGSALWNLDDGGAWWTSDVSALKRARDGLLVGTRDGSTVGLVPAS